MRYKTIAMFYMKRRWEATDRSIDFATWCEYEANRVEAAVSPTVDTVWRFNFVSGGYNSVVAPTKKKAMAKMAETYKDSKYCVPDYDSMVCDYDFSHKDPMMWD